MCGIWALLAAHAKSVQQSTQQQQPLSSSLVAECLKGLTSRGPDGTRSVQVHDHVILGFTRLAINGLSEAGMQPFGYGKGGVVNAKEGELSSSDTFVICNGEIYNYKTLGQEHGIPLTSGSDCEVLAPLYSALDADPVAFARSLDGVFAIVLVDTKRSQVVVARDPYGVRPLYTATWDDDNTAPSSSSSSSPTSSSSLFPRAGIAFASEVKGLSPLQSSCSTLEIAPFPPGTVRVYDLDTGKMKSSFQFHSFPWLKNPSYGPSVKGRAAATSAIRTALMAAVSKRLLSDRPVGALLSGGLDSSLIAALAARELRLAGEGKKLHTFSIGLPGSTDLLHARAVATHIQSIHHEVLVEEEDFLEAIPEVVEAVESYDITSVRASVGNYLVSKYINANTDVKVVFNGDGADEASGSYLYFLNAPSDAKFEAEVQRLLSDIHMFDVLRSDRSVAAHGLEARTPFLDRQFMNVYSSVATMHRRPIAGSTMEKQLLREAFDWGRKRENSSSSSNGGGSNESSIGSEQQGDDDDGEMEIDFDLEAPLLPAAVLWRRKEAFSDGVSNPERSWHSVVTEYVDKQVPGDTWKEDCQAYTSVATKNAITGVVSPPVPYTKESLWYRQLFERRYGSRAASVIPYYWLPRWSGGATDPSARTLAVYATAEDKGAALLNSGAGAGIDMKLGEAALAISTNGSSSSSSAISSRPPSASSSSSDDESSKKSRNSPQLTSVAALHVAPGSPRQQAAAAKASSTVLSPDPDGRKMWERVTGTTGC